MRVYLPYNLVRGEKNTLYKIEAYFWNFVDRDYRRVLLVKKARKAGKEPEREEAPRSGRILPRLQDGASQVRELSQMLRSLENRVSSIENTLRLHATQSLLAFPVGARLGGEEAEQLFAYRLLKSLVPSLKAPLYSVTYEALEVRVSQDSLELGDKALSLLYKIDSGVRREMERLFLKRAT